MKSEQLKTTGKILVERCFVARSFFARFLGLMGRESIPADEAVLFPKCNSIHTFFMRFAIDVVVVSASGEVIKVIVAMKPWRMMLPVRGARDIVELAAHRANELGIRVGTRLQCQGVWG